MNIPYVALKNLKRKPTRTWLLSSIVAVVSCTLFSATLYLLSAGNALRTGADRLGADILIKEGRMKRLAVLFVLSLALLAFFASAPEGALAANCAECGMMVDLESKFCAKIVQDGKTLLFCDIGDLLVHLNKKALSPAGAQVRDYKSGEWISAEKAFYVHAEKAFKTPMGWGIAAFKNREDGVAFGSPLDLTGVLRAVK